MDGKKSGKFRLRLLIVSHVLELFGSFLHLALHREQVRHDLPDVVNRLPARPELVRADAFGCVSGLPA